MYDKSIYFVFRDDVPEEKRCSGARLIRMANSRKNRVNYLSMRIIQPILHYIFINNRELCSG